MIGKAVALIQVPNQRLFKTTAAARYLGIGDDTLRKHVQEGRLRAFDLAGNRVFKLEDLDRLIDQLPEWEDPAGEKPAKVMSQEERRA